MTGFGRAAASPVPRTSNGVAAEFQDDGESGPASRAFWAGPADLACHSRGRLAVSLPGAFAAVVVSGHQKSAVADLQENLKKLPTCAPAPRGGMRKREKGVELVATGTGEDAEEPG